MSRDSFTMFVGNVDERATESLLFELFTQAGPVTSVRIPSFNGKNKSFGFVEFKHTISVPYAIQLMGGMELFGRPLNLQARGGNHRGVEPIPFPTPTRISRQMGPPRPAAPMTNDSKSRQPKSSSFDNSRHFFDDAKNLKKPGGKRHRDNSMMPAVKSRRTSASPDRTDLDDLPDTLGSGPGFMYPSQQRGQGRGSQGRYPNRDNDATEDRRGGDDRHHHHHHHHHRRNDHHNRHNNQSSRGNQKNRNNSRHNHRRKN